MADREDMEDLLTIEVHIKRRRSPEVTQEDNTSFPCAEGSLNVFDLSRPCHPSTSAEGRFVAHELEKSERTIIEEGNNKDLWSTSGDFICRHHEVPRMKWYVPTEQTFPIAMKYVGVMRQTRTLTALEDTGTIVGVKKVTSHIQNNSSEQQDFKS